MVTMRRKTVLALGVMMLVWAIGFSGTAPAAGGLARPQLRFPAGKAVPRGHVTVRVYVPNPSVVINGKIFLEITPKHKVKNGLLQLGEPCGFRCMIVVMKRQSAHVWTYRDHFLFPGLWQDTPGRYYEQAYYYPNTGVLGVVPSRVRSFRIK